MEDIKRRVYFDNVAVQLQAVERLYNEVKKKRPKGQRLSSSTPEFAELKALWQYTSSDQGQVARRCSQLWLDLLKDQCADFVYVLNGFLNQVPAAKHLYGIVEAISEMLVLQVILMKSAGDKYTCSYGIRTLPHPFITILINRPQESWPLILEQIDRLFSHTEESIQTSAIAMLEPLIKFILLDPKCSDQYLRLRSSLKIRLVNLVSRMDSGQSRNECMRSLIDLLSLMQIGTAEDLVETADFTVQLLYLYGNHADELDGCHGERLGAYALELVQLYQDKNLDSYSIVQAVLHLCRLKPEVLPRDENVALLGSIILSASPQDYMGLLQIVKVILKNGHGKLSPLCAGMVAMAAINVIATPSTVTTVTKHKLMTSLASEVMTLVEENSIDSTQKCNESLVGNLLSGAGYQARVFVKMAGTFAMDTEALKKWLVTVQKQIERMKTVSPFLTNLLVSVLLKSPDTGTSLLAIDRLSDVVKSDPTQGLYLLPVYLYVLGRSPCPTVKLHTLNALPKLGTHKFNVPPILKTIINLGQSPKLKSLSIKLLTELWALQDRCFPHLLKAVSETGKGDISMATTADEVTLAKAMAIKEICRLRPEQHGAEMLGPLSEILNTSTDSKSAPAAALCLEALYYVCEAEMIDIMSAWRVLEAQLTSDSRPVVMVKVCELLSLVPGLQVRTEEYEVFLLESVRRLWLFAQSDNNLVISAAYTALSKYSQDHFKISHLKYQIVREFVVQAEAGLAQSENEEDTVDTVMPFVPGVCYTRILADVTESISDGFTNFLSAMVAKEVDNLPRGIYYTSLRQPSAAANQGKEIAGIPIFIQSQYEKTKQPGLRPSLAVALLFCYDPRVEVGRDGRPRKHYVITHGKNYQQTFTALLQDVPVQPSDWYRTSQMGKAWIAFVDRLFAAMLEARRAEIDLQLNRDFIDENEADEKKLSAWLWVRDTICETIKKTTRSNPSVQFNAILALSALAKSTQQYVSSLDVEERKCNDAVTEYKSHSHWLMIMIDSCMSLVDFTYIPKSSLLGLCQQRSVDDRLPASVLAQAAAVLALCQVASLIVNNYVELVYKLLDMLIDWLPRQQTDEECPPVLYFFRGYGLGVLLEQLVSENFMEIAGSKGSLAVWKALDKLEECCLSQHEYRTGALLGLSVSIGSLCQDGKTESRVHIPAIYKKLKDELCSTSVEDGNFQPLCVCLAWIAGSGYVTNLLDKDTFDETVAMVTKYKESLKENAGVSRALGLLCHGGDIGGHPTIGQFKRDLFADWMKFVTSTDITELERVASLSGLMALLGSHKLANEGEHRFSAEVDQFIKCLKHLLTSSDFVGIQATASWLLGNMYLSASSTSNSSTSVPGTYSYLQESSVLRAVIDFLIDAGKQGPEFIPSEQVGICLKSLQREVTGTLPPLNWMNILSPFMKLPFNEEVKVLCIRLAVKICGSSSSAALFLAAWIVPPLFNTLNVKCQCLLLLSAKHYIKTITPAVLQTFMDKTCKPMFCASSILDKSSSGYSQGRSLLLAILKGLNSALAVPDPPESVSAILFEMVEFLFQQTSKENDDLVLLELAECIGRLPDTIVDKLTTGDCVDEQSVIRGTFVRAHLVSSGLQPVSLLNSCIDAAFNIKCDQNKVLWYLSQCFNNMTKLEGGKYPIMQWIQWLDEISGHCRNIATGKFKLPNTDADISKVTRFLVNVISATICLWISKSSAAAMFGLSSDLLTDLSARCKDDSDWLDSCHVIDETKLDWLTGVRPLECLPISMKNMNIEPWVQMLQKIMDWHCSLLETQGVITDPNVRIRLLESLGCLRHFNEYKKLTVWTRTVLYTV